MSRNRFEMDTFPVGRTYLADFPDEDDMPGWSLRLHFLSESRMIVTARFDVERVSIVVVRLRPGLFKISWSEVDKVTATHIHDYYAGKVWTDFTQPSSMVFTQRQGTLTLVPEVQV